MAKPKKGESIEECRKRNADNEKRRRQSMVGEKRESFLKKKYESDKRRIQSMTGERRENYLKRKRESEKRRRRAGKIIDKPKVRTDEMRAREKKWRQNNREKFKATQTRYRKRHPEKPAFFRRRNRIKRMFGLTMEQYESLKVAAIFCPICGIELVNDHRKGNTKVLDHSHETGKVRGFLCSNCNRGLGHFKENIVALERAIEWLTSYQ